MNVQDLNPYPEHRENFRRDRQRFLPSSAGCYVLASFQGVVLYVGADQGSEATPRQSLG